MIARRQLLLAGLGGIGILGAPAAWAGAEPARLRRGISIHNLMNWGKLQPGRPDGYVTAPFAGPEHALPDALLRNVAAAGFDFVRLTLDPGPFLQLEGEARQVLDRDLLAAIGRMRGQNLAVLVDLHPNTQVKAYDPVSWLTSASNPMFERYLALVRRVAGLLAGLQTQTVAFELMNEPPYGYDLLGRWRWQSMLGALHEAARGAAPNLTIVLTGARGGSAAGLLDLDPAPFRGSRVLYSFHYYEPHVFTHQGVVADQDGARAWRYLSGLPYPIRRIPRATVLATIARNVAEEPGLDPASRKHALKDALDTAGAYLDSGLDQTRIAADFDAVLEWARRYAVPRQAILLGEFGVTRTYGRYRAADPVSREAWLRDVRSAAELRGFGWAIWELKGSGGMATVSEDEAVTLDRTTLLALGLEAS